MPKKLPICKLLEQMRENWSEMVSAETEAVLGIIRFNDIIRERTDNALSAFNLSRAAFEVLATLRSLPQPRQLTPTDLSNSILISTGGMTKVLIYLEAKGLVERVSNDKDRRSKLVKITTDGGSLIEEVMKEVAFIDKELFSNLLISEEIAELKHTVLAALSKIELAEHW